MYKCKCCESDKGGRALPEQLADFILDESTQDSSLTTQEYDDCLELLTSNLCRKSQLSKVYKVLGLSRTPVSTNNKHCSK